ncbi:unnamed protein product [Diabrotica balteata]|uniref:guanylate cyclase n=1 Tax=Diabrotica balteata TaxID=107213 RepID=A0A9N9SNE1_DIABA|nr:unnamed protein product [Diabrotica balteata]
MSAPPARGSQKGDVYSFAILLYEIIGREGPWGKINLDMHDIIKGLKRQGQEVPLRPPIDDLGSADYIVKCIKACWHEEPEQRPDIRYVRAGLKPNIFDNMLAIMEKYAYNLEGLVQERTNQLTEEKKKTDALLHRMLPNRGFSLAEALDMVYGDEKLAEQVDNIFITPPDVNGADTDEDYANEDEDGFINNLTGRQLRAQAEIQLSSNERIGSDNEEVQTDGKGEMQTYWLVGDDPAQRLARIREEIVGSTLYSSISSETVLTMKPKYTYDELQKLDDDDENELFGEILDDQTVYSDIVGDSDAEDDRTISTSTSTSLSSRSFCGSTTSRGKETTSEAPNISNYDYDDSIADPNILSENITEKRYVHANFKNDDIRLSSKTPDLLRRTGVNLESDSHLFENCQSCLSQATCPVVQLHQRARRAFNPVESQETIDGSFDMLCPEMYRYHTTRLNYTCVHRNPRSAPTITFMEHNEQFI